MSEQVYKLSAKWSKREKDIVVSWPDGKSTKSDARLLAGIIDDHMLSELDRRGYDIRTLKFEITAKSDHERFGVECEEAE